MTSRIPENIRQTVIRLWFEGKSRKDIASTCGVSEGTVSNIIADYIQKLGDRDAEALRESGINMKRAGIDAVQCAQGFRIFMIMRKMGVNEEDFESFISKVYGQCQRVGLTPDEISSYMEDLFEFSKDDDANNNHGNAIKLSEIPYYIEQMKNEKRTLKHDIQNLRKEKEISQDEISDLNELRNAAFELERTTVTELREYSNLKAELRRYGLSIEEDIPKFVQLVHGIKRYEYDVDKVLSDYSDEQIKQIKFDLLIDKLKKLEDTKMKLRSECFSLKEKVDMHRQMLYVYNELKSMGVGLRELKILYNTIKEIAAENNIINHWEAVDKFFEFLEQRYDIKLRLRILQEKQQQKEYNNSKHDKPDQRQVPSPSSISYTYRKTTTALPKTTKEDQNNQLNNIYYYPDEWSESDDDNLL